MYDDGGSDQLPVEAVTLAPTLAVPVTSGGAVFCSRGCSVTVNEPRWYSQHPVNTLMFQLPGAAPVRSSVAVTERLSAATESVFAPMVRPSRLSRTSVSGPSAVPVTVSRTLRPLAPVSGETAVTDVFSVPHGEEEQVSLAL